MGLKVWIDGKLFDKEQAKISVYDHGFLYGDGVFEGLRVYQGRIFACEGHLRRLFDSAHAIRLAPPRSAEELKAAMEETIRANGFTECYIRLIVTRGSGYLGLSPVKCPVASVVIIADTIELYPKEVYEKGMALITSSVMRTPAHALSPRIKSMNYLNNILAKIEAIDAGVAEALMLNQHGNVAECTADNIFIVRGGVVQTPPTTDGVLEGITRQAIFEVSRKMSITCTEKTLEKHDIYNADECFMTGTAAEIVPVTKLDGRTIGNGQPGPMTRKLLEAFHRLVREG